MATISPLAPQSSGYFAPGSYDRAARAYRLLERLSARQRQVLQFMAAGSLNKQIAWRLSIAEKTVKMHRALLIDALEVRSSAEAITLFAEASFLGQSQTEGWPDLYDEQHS